MIQQVITGSNRGKHFAHGARGGLGIGGAFRSSAEDSGFGESVKFFAVRRSAFRAAKRHVIENRYVLPSHC